MKNKSGSGIAISTLLTGLSLLLLMVGRPETVSGAATNEAPGSLIMRGPSAGAKSAGNSAENSADGSLGMTSPEHLFGLKVEAAMGTNGGSIIANAVDLDAYYRRVTVTLPTVDAVKKKIQATPQSWIARKMLLKEFTEDIGNNHIRFLGTRRYQNETMLLFRSMNFRYEAFYTGYVTARRADGSIAIVDVLRFRSGELKSEIERRDYLLDLAPDGIVGPLRVHDQALVSNVKAWKLFTSRCAYGKFDLIKEAYDQLPAELQNDRLALSLYASSGQKIMKELMVPIERWRQQFPGDPCPDVLVVDFWWLFSQEPHFATDSSGARVQVSQGWTPEEKTQVIAAVERANKWLADPAMEIRLAHTLGADEADKAEPLLQQALKRYPTEASAFLELLNIQLAKKDFGGVAQTLHQQEDMLHSDLTAMVDETSAYAEFKKSFAWKKWQHDYHGADIKALTVPATAAKGS